MRVQSQIQAKQKTRAALHRAAPSSGCAPRAKLPQWKPAVRKSLDEARRFADDLDSGKVTRESLIANGELLTADAFIRRLHERMWRRPRQPFNYTEWRRENLFVDESVDSLMDAAEALEK